MFEKVNPSHPDKIADRIAGALVDLAYKKDENPKVAIEVLIGHGTCHIIAETSVVFRPDEVARIVERIAGKNIITDFRQFAQDEHLAANQTESIKCGDNGIFKGMPISREQEELTKIAQQIYDYFDCDGKYILANGELIICQSNSTEYNICEILNEEGWDYPAYINPLGRWTGGTEVDCGATNRKLGSDMGDGVTGGGLHGKDLSKADVSVNIYAHLRAQYTNRPVELYCAIGDDCVDGLPYSNIVEIARDYINEIGGFEKFAEWGLIR